MLIIIKADIIILALGATRSIVKELLSGSIGYCFSMDDKLKVNQIPGWN